jgi:hypothetical protein
MQFFQEFSIEQGVHRKESPADPGKAPGERVHGYRGIRVCGMEHEQFSPVLWRSEQGQAQCRRPRECRRVCEEREGESPGLSGNHESCKFDKVLDPTTIRGDYSGNGGVSLADTERNYEFIPSSAKSQARQLVGCLLSSHHAPGELSPHHRGQIPLLSRHPYELPVCPR